MTEYKESDYIQEAPPEKLFGHRAKYRYRVIGRHGFPTHHTNSLSDARQWFRKCVGYWENNPCPMWRV